MKKLLTLSFLLVVSGVVTAQNIQLHYDFGRNIYKELKKSSDTYGRPALTTTIEMFRPDSFGSTYFFVDVDYAPGVKGAYMEVAREFCFWQDSKLDWLSIHVEYNGGISQAAGSFNNSWLGGLTYSGHSKDFTKTWSLSVMYKYIPGTVDHHGSKCEHNFQITGVWGIEFAKGWMTYSGFIDFWQESRAWQQTSHILISEHQLWFNMNKIKNWDKINLSIGTEVEFSNNFVSNGFYVIPTLAAKWTF